jgi:HEPN domain-containing protein
MSQMYDRSSEEDLEYLLAHGVTFSEGPTSSHREEPGSPHLSFRDDEDDETSGVPQSSDLQGALGLFAEACQDMATTGVELSLGRHFACADFCNQAVEKAAQAVSLLRFGRRSMYDHDLRALGAAIGAPEAIQNEMAILTPFHPEAFYVDTPPEEADEVISAEQASSYMQSARTVLRWVRNIILKA